MAVALDNTGNSAGGTAISSLSIASFAIGAGSNRLLFVGVSQYSNPDRAPGGNFNTSETLTLHDAVTQAESPGTRRATILKLVNPSNATATVQATWGGSVDEAVVGAISFTGVDQTTPLGTAVKASGTTGDVANTVSSSIGNMVADCLSVDASVSPLAVGNQTERWDAIAATNTTEGGGQTAAGAASVAMNWNLSILPSDIHAALAVDVIATGASPPTSPPLGPGSEALGFLWEVAGLCRSHQGLLWNRRLSQRLPQEQHEGSQLCRNRT